MKKFIKNLIICATAIACAASLAACAPSENDDEIPDKELTLAEQQVVRAQNTYNSFYKKSGGLFSERQNSAAVAVAAAAFDDIMTFDGVREIIAKYNASYGDYTSLFNTYVADIFSYSQVQTSIIDEFGEAALTAVYTLNYDEVDWDSDTTGYGQWVKESKLLSAAFAGTDLSNGNVYCTQAHKSMGTTVLANLEYYYNSDGDMGVTTINMRSNGTFEYHYCSAGTGEVLMVSGTQSDGNIYLNMINFWFRTGMVSNVSSQQDRQSIFDYVYSEISRINGKIADLQEQNERERILDGTEESEEENVGVCSVKMDFSVLGNMIIK